MSRSTSNTFHMLQKSLKALKWIPRGHIHMHNLQSTNKASLNGQFLKWFIMLITVIAIVVGPFPSWSHHEGRWFQRGVTFKLPLQTSLGKFCKDFLLTIAFDHWEGCLRRTCLLATGLQQFRCLQSLSLWPSTMDRAITM